MNDASPKPFIPVLLSEDTLRPIPCLAVLYFFVAGSMPLSLVAFEYCGVSTAVVLMLVMTGAGWTLFPESCRRCRFMVLAGMGLALLHSAAPWRSYEKHLLRPEVHAEIRAVVIEDHLRFGDDEVLNFLGDTRRVQLRVTHVRLSREQEWQPCSGRVLLSVPPPRPALSNPARRAGASNGLRYGQTIEARGSFRLPHKSALPGRMDYPAYLRTKGIRHLYYPSEITTISETPTGWRRGAAVWFEMREHLLARVVRGLEHPENQSALAAMTLGFRQSLDSDQRNTYLKSGMIHIFAISGLHVGILFI